MSAADAREFQVEACLGRGGFGEVYRARMRRSGFETEVALKVLKSDVDPRSQAAQRLRDEARLLGVLRHRAIPRVLDLVPLGGRLVLVSEYVEGADLSQCLRAEPPLGERAIAEVIAAVADALHAAFAARLADGTPARIVHRDLKPANVRISRDGRPMLLDFGIAWTDAVTRVAATQTSALVGSPAYMAPERFEGVPPTPANDVFGLGAVLYECLTSRRLFGGISLKTLAGIALYEERYERAMATRLAVLPEDLDPTLRRLVHEMLAFDPGRRPRAGEISHLLEELAPTLPGPSLTAWCRRHDWDAIVVRPGPWVGRTLTEDAAGTLAPTASTASDPAELSTEDVSLPSLDLEPLTADLPTPQPAPSRRSPVLPLALGATLALALSATTLALLAPWPRARPPEIALDADAQLDAEADIQPDAEPEPGPEPESESESESESEADIQPDAESESEPEPEPEPEPESEPRPDPTPTRPATPPARSPRRVTAPPRVDDLLPPEPEPEPRAQPEPTPEPVVRATPEPRPVRLASTVTPSPAPAPAPTGPWVRPAAGAPAMALRAGDGRILPLPARVPPGRYTVMAELTAGIPTPAGAVTVGTDDLEVRCASGLCGARR